MGGIKPVICGVPDPTGRCGTTVSGCGAAARLLL